MTGLLICEIEDVIGLLEAAIPANPESPKNRRLRRQFADALEKYFRSLSAAFPYSRLEGLYNRNLQESLGSDIDDVLDPLLAAFNNSLGKMVDGQLSETYLSGQAEMITWGKTKAGIPIAYEGPPISAAVDWAKAQGAQLVTQMDAETKRRLALHISNGINNKVGVPALARDIRAQFGEMSRFRSIMIARTETANALSTASLDNMKGMGIEGKQWITVGDDEVSEECEANEADGVIPRNQAFTSGTMAPPQHPNCRCSVAPAVLPG